MEPVIIAAMVCFACFVAICVLGVRDYDFFSSKRAQKVAFWVALIGLLASSAFVLFSGAGRIFNQFVD
jgi:hypothetical protein